MLGIMSSVFNIASRFEPLDSGQHERTHDTELYAHERRKQVELRKQRELAMRIFW